MSVLTPSSKVILRYINKFTKRCILFAGDIQDTLPVQFTVSEVRVHTQYYHCWQLWQKSMGNNAQFGLILDAKFIAKSDTLIFYWPKSKESAYFQLYNILSLLPIGADIFIIGENRMGVRSAVKIVANYTTLTKIESAYSCSLYHGRLDVHSRFSLVDWWKSYRLHDVEIKTLPGIFSRNGLDAGSALLLSTFQEPMQGKVLDLGSGAGVLAAILCKISPKVKLTLSDVNASALCSSYATLVANGIKGEVIVSNVYSNISARFNMIISNPPFHDGVSTNLRVVEKLIYNACKHLMVGGFLRIVANAFLPYPDMLDATFGSHEVLTQNRYFKVYQAVAGLPNIKHEE